MASTLTGARTAAPSGRISDRRTALRRQTLEEHGIVHARVLPGKDVTIINVSARGALVETQYRLLPGSPVELLVEGDPGCATVRGRVLRCFVSGVRSACVSYRGAIAFDGDLRWLDDPADAGL